MENSGRQHPHDTGQARSSGSEITLAMWEQLLKAIDRLVAIGERAHPAPRHERRDEWERSLEEG